MDHSTANPAVSRTTAAPLQSAQQELGHWILRWLLFFLICNGLGYAAVERFDPRASPGLSDSALYYRLVSGEEVQARELRFRGLVPYLAKPFHWLARRFLGAPHSVFLALLIANSIFCATTACLLVSAGLRVTGNLAVSLLATCLYLLNFAIANLALAGMIDAGEACLMMLVTWALLGDRWWLLPAWGLLGVLAKETFLPLAMVFTLAWWLIEGRNRRGSMQKLALTMVMVVVGIVTISVLRLAISGQSVEGISAVAGGSALGDISERNPGPGYFSELISALSSRSFWYVFVWLLPLGLVRLKRLPRAWVFASIGSAAIALALGVYRNIGGNVARPMFDAMGPVLSLSVALLLAGNSGYIAGNNPDSSKAT